MGDDRVDKTKKIAELYFKGVEGERPFELWRAFDPEMARALSLFVTGDMYAREKIPHATRQLVAVAALTALGQRDELELHIQAALNVGCPPDEIAEAIFQTGVYAGVPAMNTALKALRAVMETNNMWPPEPKASS